MNVGQFTTKVGGTLMANPANSIRVLNSSDQVVCSVVEQPDGVLVFKALTPGKARISFQVHVLLAWRTVELEMTVEP